MHSRLEHHERSLLLRQIGIYLGSTVALGLLFLFVILPGFIRILAFRNLGSKPEEQQSAFLPQRPFLEQPFTATSSATVSLKGTAQADSKVILLKNGVADSDTKASGDGNFTFENISLDSGNNTFAAVVEDDSEKRSNPSASVQIAYVKDGPKLEISEPANETTITQQKQNPIRIKGKTDPGSRVFINDKLQFIAQDGSFNGQFQLSQGDNTVTVKAINAAQVETVQELLLRFSP